jgi:hypothetical protein
MKRRAGTDVIGTRTLRRSFRLVSQLLVVEHEAALRMRDKDKIREHEGRDIEKE